MRTLALLAVMMLLAASGGCMETRSVTPDAAAARAEPAAEATRAQAPAPPAQARQPLPLLDR